MIDRSAGMSADYRIDLSALETAIGRDEAEGLRPCASSATPAP
jgi:hypothetical protein